MRRLSDSCVYLCGLGGVGVEVGNGTFLLMTYQYLHVAKNLVLAGVKSLILDDSSICTAEDMASQFYVHPEHVSKKKTR